ncbi:MAG: hypothetical protein P4M11_01340 [Candidatus Pacebacteria bacterium]|nr:hypothetical protein [Candidatus Paceibacterota bacterium]
MADKVVHAAHEKLHNEIPSVHDKLPSIGEIRVRRRRGNYALQGNAKEGENQYDNYEQ